MYNDDIMAFIIAGLLFEIARIVCEDLGAFWKEIRVLGNEKHTKLLQLAVFFMSLFFTTPVVLVTLHWSLWPLAPLFLATSAVYTYTALFCYSREVQLTIPGIRRVHESAVGDFIEGTFAVPHEMVLDAFRDFLKETSWRHFSEFIILLIGYVVFHGFVLTCMCMRPYMGYVGEHCNVVRA